MITFDYSAELRLHTQKVHIALEQALIPLIKSISNRGQYADLLKKFYGFYAPMEERLAPVSGIEKITAGMPLRKAESLRKDLIALRSNIDQLFLCDNLPQCNDWSRAFGIMYVLEGSVLGGSAIAAIISKNLPDDTLPFSFFLHYGDEAKNVWNQFKAKLDSTESLSKPAVLSAATETFTLFKEWMCKNDNTLPFTL